MMQNRFFSADVALPEKLGTRRKHAAEIIKDSAQTKQNHQQFI
jgi:hypothetical protein